jgi:hypothetical protein
MVNRKTETENIREMLTRYFIAVDAQNAIDAGGYLESNFRVVLNNFKDLPEPTVLDKNQYLGMMQAGKVGGSPRSVSFEFIDSNRSVAIAKVVLESENTVFRSYYQLINKAGSWYILSDTPEVNTKS